MPAKKSSPTNPAVSTARFVPMDEDTSAPTTVPAPANPLPTTEAHHDTSMAANPAPAGPRPDDSKPEKPSSKDKDRDAVTIEDLTLPRSIITRLAKGVLPPNTQIQANAILALNKSAAVFVNYLATHANEHTLNAGKKTIDPTHVFKALDDTELSFLKEPLEAEFAKYAQTKSEKRIDYRRRQRQSGTGAAAPGSTADGPGDDSQMGDVSTMSAPGPDDTLTSAANAGASEGDDRPRTKKAKIGAAGAAGAGAAGAAMVVANGDDTEPEEAEEEEGDETDDAEEEDEPDDDEGEEEEGESEAEETVDALEGDEERAGRDEADEALDGNESD
ncbi:hypothetical protein ACHAQH_004554 [Verticillium albo-atrum]